MAKACHTCGEDGHFKRDCPYEQAGGEQQPVDNSGKECRNCGTIGHIARDCPYEQTCHKCRKPGHIRIECNEQAACRNCGESGHIARECPYEQTCQHCHETGHLRYDCPKLVGNRRKGAERGACHNCGQVGHFKRDCPGLQEAGSTEAEVEASSEVAQHPPESAAAPLATSNGNAASNGNGSAPAVSKACHSCGEVGHLKRDCQNNQYRANGEQGNGSSHDARTCHTCGQVGHLKRDCPVALQTRSCHSCGEAGHLMRNCHKQQTAVAAM